MERKFKTPDPRKARRYFARKLAFTVTPAELGRWMEHRKDLRILDVRDGESFEHGHIPGAAYLPEDRWQKPRGLNKRHTHVVYGHEPLCRLAAQAAYALASLGIPVVELDGGYAGWRQLGYPIETSPAGVPSLTQTDSGIQFDPEEDASSSSESPETALPDSIES